MMKILLVGSANVFAIEKSYFNYLSCYENVSIDFFKAADIFLDYYYRSLANKIKFRLGFSDIYKNINNELIQYVQNNRPDIIWFFKGMEIFPQTLEWLRNQRIKLVNYNPDSPFIFSGSGSGNKNVTKSIHLYDLHFTYNKEIQHELEDRHKLRTSYLPFGFELSDHLYEQICELEEINEACFVGTCDRKRSRFILELAKAGIRINVFGNGWERIADRNNVIAHRFTAGDDLYFTLRKYRVQLNLMRPHNLNSHNMRTFEVAGAGGIMVGPDTIEHRMFFEHEKEVFLFKNVNECAKTIQTVLAMSKEEANEIRSNARHRSITSGYQYKERTEFVHSMMMQL